MSDPIYPGPIPMYLVSVYNYNQDKAIAEGYGFGHYRKDAYLDTRQGFPQHQYWDAELKCKSVTIETIKILKANPAKHKLMMRSQLDFADLHGFTVARRPALFDSRIELSHDHGTNAYRIEFQRNQIIATVTNGDGIQTYMPIQKPLIELLLKGGYLTMHS